MTTDDGRRQARDDIPIMDVNCFNAIELQPEIAADVWAYNLRRSKGKDFRHVEFPLMKKLEPGKKYWQLDRVGKLPVKYMAVESLTLKKFSVMSDVYVERNCVFCSFWIL